MNIPANWIGMALSMLGAGMELSSNATLACSLCLPSSVLTFLFSSSLILAGGFFCWLLFRSRYEPGKRGNTFLWLIAGLLCALLGAASIPFLWTAFFACWLLKLCRQVWSNEVSAGTKVSQPGFSESADAELMIEPGSGQGQVVVQGKYGFNQTLLVVVGCALALKMILMQLGCRGWITFSLAVCSGVVIQSGDGF